MTGRQLRVAVVGGGLAGISAALTAADGGASVTLYESRRELGGLTRSFVRDGPAGRMIVDSGQHVFLRCCTGYRRFVARLGADALVWQQPRLDVGLVAYGRVGRLRADPLPAPWHLARSMAAFGWLSWSERARAAAAVAALDDLDPDDPGTDEQTFGHWLRRHHQSDRAISLLWDLVGLPTLNARADDVSLALAAMVFKTGLMAEPDAAALGWPLVPLRRLHGDVAAAALTAAGVELRTRTAITDLAELSGSDRVILATPPAVADRLLPAGVLEAQPGWAGSLGSVPIINLHVVYDRVVFEHAFLATIDSPLQWIFDRTWPAGLRSGQYLAISLSGAGDLVGLPVAELRARFEPELHRLLPETRRARVIDFFVSREREATFRPAPGQAGLRPGAQTRDPRLLLAGAWTRTGWPATMEGAVRSGERAGMLALQAAAGYRDDHSRNDQSRHDHAGHDQSSRDESSRDQPKRDQSTHDQPNDDRPVEEVAV